MRLMQRGYAAPAVFASAVAVCLHGVAAHGLLRQPVWEPDGWRRFLFFAAIYASSAALLIAVRPRWTLAVLAGAAALFTCFAVGPLALAGVVWAALGAWACGWLLWPRARGSVESPAAVQITLGLALWAAAVMWTAALPLHHRALYWLLPALTAAAAWQRGWRPRLSLAGPAARWAAAAWAVALFPLFAHWLVALKPEVSADGLAMHMVIPARMAYAHRWPFDVTEFVWAVMPMGGDWVWTVGWQLGGEAAARLMNVLLLGLITWIVAERAFRRLHAWPAALLTAAMLSTPLVQHVTGSLFVENATAVWLTAAAVVLVESRLVAGRSRVALGVLAGMAAATKFGALAFLAPLVAAGIVVARPRAMATAALWMTLIGAAPYLNAWLRTGNPVFPFLNGLFRSPLYEPVNFRDTRFETPLGWTTFYDVTFHSGRFLESLDGAGGFLVFALLPASLAAWRRNWPEGRSILLLMVLAGAALSFGAQSNLRYLYPALPLTVLIGAEVLRESGLERRWARAAVLAGLTLVLLLHGLLLPAAGYYHREFFVSRWWKPRADTAYVLAHAPERKLVEWLNRNAPGTRAAWFWGNAVGDFRGRTWTASWHSPDFWTRFRTAPGPDAIERLLRELRVDFVLAPAAAGRRIPQTVYERQFLDSCMESVLGAADMELYQWRRTGSCWTGEPPEAGAGVHDDTSPSLRFSGAWIRDTQFPQTHAGTVVYTNARDAEVGIRFRGSAIRLMYTAAFNRCAAAAELDSGGALRFDQRSAETRWQQWSPWIEAPQPGAHTLRLRIAPDSPGGCWIDLDGFEVR
ncbi:MAG: hypothetical protein KatS3mg004_1299 [Bryobacteraceae bacterium]|nr:MAG: hypothetical protein KatS3mg004_1299 [Bryobacteraceae bacterium]